jgi:hypothetical protein
LRLVSADRIRRGELETGADDSGFERSDSALGVAPGFVEGRAEMLRLSLRLRPFEETEESRTDGRSPESARPCPREELLTREGDADDGAF